MPDTTTKESEYPGIIDWPADVDERGASVLFFLACVGGAIWSACVARYGYLVMSLLYGALFGWHVLNARSRLVEIGAQIDGLSRRMAEARDRRAGSNV